MLFREVHHSKALSPIVVTLSGITILIKFSQSPNAKLPIEVIPLLIVTRDMLSLYLYHGVLIS